MERKNFPFFGEHITTAKHVTHFGKIYKDTQKTKTFVTQGQILQKDAQSKKIYGCNVIVRQGHMDAFRKVTASKIENDFIKKIYYLSSSHENCMSRFT